MAHDRAWRNLASRPISPQNVMTKAWLGAKPAFSPDSSSASTEADGIPEPNRDRALGEADRTGRHFDEAEPPDDKKPE